MAEIHFTSHLRNLVPDGPLAAPGATVGEALANVLAAQPHVRSYVLDERSGWASKLIGFEGVAVTNVLSTDGVI